MFPLFAARFFNAEGETPAGPSTSTPRRSTFPAAAPVARSAAAGRIASLKALDLQTLPREDGPPTELRTRKEKLAFYDQQCSHVGDRLYVSGETVAKSRDMLHASQITHIINCVGFLYPPYFEDEFTYQTLYLQDTPSEDILSVLYDVFDFIEAAPEGRVLVHCSQGVSRSTTLAIAYRMWREGRSFEEVFADVKELRGVANPNIGFICQLLQWEKRRVEAAVPRLYRIAPQSPSAPQYLVPKMTCAATAAALDPRGAFVLHAPAAVHIWSGAQCPETFTQAARRVASQLQRYEGAPAVTVEVDMGCEPGEFWQALGGDKPQGAVRQVAAYDRDFELYSRSRVPPGSGAAAAGGESCDSARSGRKTPRAATGDAANSPNDRLRKLARSEAGQYGDRTARSSGGSSTSGSELEVGLGTASARARHLEFEQEALRRRAGSLPTLPRPPPPTVQAPAAATATAGPPLAPRGQRPAAVPKLSLGVLQAPRSSLSPAGKDAAQQAKQPARREAPAAEAAAPPPALPPRVPQLNLAG